MLNRLFACLCALTCFSGPALSQATCEPAKLVKAIDRYAIEPFSARTWRMLRGLGDPMVEPNHRGDNWAAAETWKTLAGGLAPDGEYLQQFGYNCRIGYPLEVLRQRSGKLGKDHPYVKQWLRVQDKVMEACTYPERPSLALPDPIEADPALAKMQSDDRSYQAAAAAFYRDSVTAIELFKAIGGSDSEHKAAARYNVANLLANAKRFAEARTEAGLILADQSLASVHGITKELLGYISNIEDTAEGWAALIDVTVATIEQPGDAITKSEQSRQEYASALYDIEYAGVNGKDDDWWLDGKLPENPTVSKALVDTSRKHPMVLWMMAGQSADEYYRHAPWSLIGEKWQARLTAYVDKALAIQPSGSELKGSALAMLVAMKAKPDDASRKALWDAAKAAAAAAQRTCGEDPQTAAAGHLLAHAVRLSAMSGNFEEAYAGLGTVPFKTARAYYESSVLKFAQYLLGQGNVAEARKLRDRLITGELRTGLLADRSMPGRFQFANLLGWIAEDEGYWKQSRAMDWNAADHPIFNLLPSKKLWALADDETFGQDERALFARAAWTRDYARGQPSTKDHTSKLRVLNPGIAEIAAKTAADFPRIGAERLRLLTVLRGPRHNILVDALADSIKQSDVGAIDTLDHNDKNWWCPLEPDRQLAALRANFDGAAGTGLDLEYSLKNLEAVYDPALHASIDRNRETVMKQHPVVKAIDWKEVAALANAASAPQRLTEAAIRWGKASNGNDGAPEALALAVRTTRYGCRWHGPHGSYSKTAQQLLQARFKDTAWAKQTPYWFDCMRREWDQGDNKGAVCEAKTWPKQAPIK